MEGAFTLKLEPKRYLDSEGNLRLPESMRAYVGPAGCEMDGLDDEQRLVDLGYLITHGWDFKQALREYLDDHEEYERDIHMGLYNLLFGLRGYEGVSWLKPDEHEATGYQLLNLFIRDIHVYYEEVPYLYEHGIKDMRWDILAIMKENKLTKYDVCELQKKPTSEWIRNEYPFKKDE